MLLSNVALADVNNLWSFFRSLTKSETQIAATLETESGEIKATPLVKIQLKIMAQGGQITRITLTTDEITMETIGIHSRITTQQIDLKEIQDQDPT